MTIFWIFDVDNDWNILVQNKNLYVEISERLIQHWIAARNLLPQHSPINQLPHLCHITAFWIKKHIEARILTQNLFEIDLKWSRNLTKNAFLKENDKKVYFRSNKNLTCWLYEYGIDWELSSISRNGNCLRCYISNPYILWSYIPSLCNIQTRIWS